MIELAIVMIIMGVLTVPLLQIYQNYQQGKKKGDTLLAQSEIQGAISNWQGMNGRYLCPSDRAIAFGATGHGIADCAKVAALGPNSCTSNRGMCKAVRAGREIYIGGVPYASLGIPFYSTQDGWGNGLKYVVTAEMTPALPYAALPFNPDNGAVEIVNEAGLAHTNLYHGVIISLGPNGAGSFNLYGNQTPCDMGVVESENCDEDGTFMDGLISLGDNNRYYDDIIDPNGWTKSTIWEYSNLTDVKNANTGNVGVGTTTPQSKLDVAGDVKADAIRSGQICDANGQNCFPSATIGGVGIRCPAGRVLVGIANNAPICESISLSVTGTCPAGQFVVRITAGGVQCATP